MLVYPTLNLYIYDIRAGLGQNDEDIQKNRADFKRKLRLVSEENQRILDHLDQETEKEYLELFDKNRVNSLPSDSNFPKHDGYYYPVRFNDSYGLLLNCSLAENQKTNDLTWLKSLQQLVANRISSEKGTLGETWFFSAQLDNLEQSKELATKIYQTLIPDANATDYLIGKSDFLNGEIFEYAKNYDDKHHVIISFYSEETQEQEFFSDWMSLLFYRHKITWAYNQSRQLVKLLKQGAINIKTTEQQLRNSTNDEKLDSEQLQNTLNDAWNILSEYSTRLDELNDQIHTIEINLNNYQKRLTRLSEKSKSSLKVFENFHELAEEKYCKQVQNDYKAFSPKLRRLENLINYIRASVAIREETRDRELLHTATFLGVGLAVGAIVSSVIEQAPLTEASQGWDKFGYSLIISIGAAILAGLVVWKRQKK
jgi:predicted  nucleic acid-binding Zn-ribbon protein